MNFLDERLYITYTLTQNEIYTFFLWILILLLKYAVVSVTHVYHDFIADNDNAIVLKLAGIIMRPTRKNVLFTLHVRSIIGFTYRFNTDK